MQQTSTLFKESRQQKGLSTKQVGDLLGLDGSLVSRIENGRRLPTREQLMKLADLYQLDREELLIDWLSEKLLRELEGEMEAEKVFRAAEVKLKYRAEEKKPL